MSHYGGVDIFKAEIHCRNLSETSFQPAGKSEEMTLELVGIQNGDRFVSKHEVRFFTIYILWAWELSELSYLPINLLSDMLTVFRM